MTVITFLEKNGDEGVEIILLTLLACVRARDERKIALTL